ncbi:MAG: hypothetical protein GY694_02625 [Gammaproteobacteria bacterium]|nr:hypothetical protein [Gammaproteobacteria bacterium]
MKSKKQYPLQIAISTLFITVIVTLAASLVIYQYKQTSEIILTEVQKEYQHISNELALDLKVQYGSVVKTMNLLSLSPLVNEKLSENRINYLAELHSVLTNYPVVTAAGVGYENGEALMSFLLKSEELRQAYHAPENATSIALLIELNKNQKKEMVSIFFDDSLNEIKRTRKPTDFDPRQRLWYKNAALKPGTTKPYIFYGTDILGFAAMQKSSSNSVTVVNVRLDSLSRNISKYKVTPRSEVVLINKKGIVYAHGDLSNESQQNLRHIDTFNSDILNFYANTLTVEEGVLSFSYQGEEWVGSVRILGSIGGEKIYALMLSPVNELLKDIITIQEHSLLVSLFFILLSLPFIFIVSKKISFPILELSHEARLISHFEFNERKNRGSIISEVAELENAMEMMKSTINKFINLINSLAGEKDLDVLLESITKETMLISHSDEAVIYLLDEKESYLKAGFMCDKNDQLYNLEKLSNLSIEDAKQLLNNTDYSEKRVLTLSSHVDHKLSGVLSLIDQTEATVIVLGLNNRDNEIIGLLCLIYNQDDRSIVIKKQRNIDFIQALSGFAAVTLESKQAVVIQQALLDAFIKLIAGAIDAKSPYTGGHCQRVPEIAMMLAKAACESEENQYKDYSLTHEQWEELSIAGWLHDCGKVTTPEFVVDKATKLETIYDRIHEVRMRFEVLKRDVDINYWQQLFNGGDKTTLEQKRDQEKKQIDDDFRFIAQCNIGGEFMADDKIERLNKIAQTTWMRTMDDSLGLSWEESNRRDKNINAILPAEEKLLDNKQEHLIDRHEVDKIPAENPWGFKVETPEFKYNKGELYNLSVKRGTLNDEERYMINGHMIQTIMMLDKLPFPKHLQNVPLIAGSHHETIDGKGYPRKLSMAEESLSARIMVIADIFEALTASDRPYKKAKTLSESIKILSFFKKDKHIDPCLFDLFLTSGVYLKYAEKYLLPEQIDEVDISQYL